MKKKQGKNMQSHVKKVHKLHKEMLRGHSKLMGTHSKMEKAINKMSAGAQISTGKKGERSQPSKSAIVKMDEGRGKPKRRPKGM